MYRNAFVFIMEWLWRLVYLNVVWILFSLPIITLIPSTFAMFSVANKWFTEDEDIAIFRTFKKDFSANFLKSYRYGLPLLLFGLFLYIDLRILLILEEPFFMFVRYVIMIIILLYIIILMFTIPIFLNYRFPLFKTYFFALMLGLRQPIVSLLVLIGIFLTIGIFLFFTGIGIFFIGSLPAFMISKAVHNAIRKITM